VSAVEYLVLSDAVIIVDTGQDVDVITDDGVSRFADRERKALLNTPPESPRHLSLLLEMVEEQRKHRNREDGYWLAGPAPEAASHAITGSIPNESLRAAALMSDGVSAIVDVYEEMTWTDLLRELTTLGPVSVLARLREIEASDAAGTRWPRFKTSDDATVATVDLGSCAVEGR
jgi:hypothetical protein